MSIHDQDTVALSLSGGSLGLALREINTPRQLGSVRLIREIGRGGMGVVWLGHDDMLGRDVAVKFLLGAAATDDDPNFAVFLEGARAAAKLKCPGMTAVFHADVVDHAPYIVMEYVDGPTLGRVVQKSGSLPLPAALGVMEKVCATVAELHEAGIIHRDIKPSNIMLDTDCRVYLTDFGIAITRPVGESGSDKAGLAGTPAYMAPEAFDEVASTRTDTYALGVTMFELLTGAAPFEGEYTQVREMHRTRELPLAALRDKNIDPSIVEIVERATNKDPKYRYKTARHLLEALERAPLPKAVRQRADSELRSAALRCRAGGDGPADKEGSSATLSGRSLYDHLSTLAAKKRSDMPTPAAHPRVEEQPVSGDSETASIELPMPGVSSYTCPSCRARFSSPAAVVLCPSCGSGVVGSTPRQVPVNPHEAEEELLRPTTVLWIGAGVFGVILVIVLVVVFWPWK
ncbi:MAG: serine/threonine protein kinase [Phycisphaerae bacterium]|nr:serine/threonine protein kinase [Phycisphaerae bacterium]